MTRDQLTKILSELHVEVKQLDKLTSNGVQTSCLQGMLIAHFCSLWEDLPPESFLKEYIPDRLTAQLEQTRQLVVLKKLES